MHFQVNTKSLSNTAITVEIEADINPGRIDHGMDPTLVATAYKENRFFLFTNRSARDLSSLDNDRDVFNDKPSKEDGVSAMEETVVPVLFKTPKALLMNSLLDDPDIVEAENVEQDPNLIKSTPKVNYKDILL